MSIKYKQFASRLIRFENEKKAWLQANGLRTTQWFYNEDSKLCTRCLLNKKDSQFKTGVAVCLECNAELVQDLKLIVKKFTKKLDK